MICLELLTTSNSSNKSFVNVQSSFVLQASYLPLKQDGRSWWTITPRHPFTLRVLRLAGKVRPTPVRRPRRRRRTRRWRMSLPPPLLAGHELQHAKLIQVAADPRLPPAHHTDPLARREHHLHGARHPVPPVDHEHIERGAGVPWWTRTVRAARRPRPEFVCQAWHARVCPHVPYWRVRRGQLYSAEFSLWCPCEIAGETNLDMHSKKLLFLNWPLKVDMSNVNDHWWFWNGK